MTLITCMDGWAFFKESCWSFFFPFSPLSAVCQESMASCLFNAFSRISLKVKHTSMSLPSLLPLHFCSKMATNNKDNVCLVMISNFLHTCTPLLVWSVWQWRLIVFSLKGDINMINFRIKWMKLEDRCNMRSEINLLWCEESQEMWGINKYEITFSVFPSYGKRASFGRASLWGNCDPPWPSSGWEELANEILSIYQPLFQNHALAWTPGNQFTATDKNKEFIQNLSSQVLICLFFASSNNKGFNLCLLCHVRL